MKTIISGGRDYILGHDEVEALHRLDEEHQISKILSGCASGVDTCAEMWAKMSNIPVVRFPADWKKYGYAAGPNRNRKMAAVADAVVLFPGGRGTKNMKEEAIKAGIKVFEYSPILKTIPLLDTLPDGVARFPTRTR